MLDSKILAKFKRMTKNNNHGGAHELASTYLGLDDLADKFARINREHTRLGYLSYDLNRSRYKLYEQLMSDARKMMSEEEYKKFYNCF